MKSTGIVIITSIIISIVLSSVGAYMITDNLIHPQGNLFEGVVLFSLGVIVLLLLTIASTLGRAIQVFTDVYTQQVELQKTVTEFYSKAQRPKSISEILGGITNMGQDSITITNLETGETTSSPLGEGDPMKKIRDLMTGIMKNETGQDKGDLDFMSIEQLEKELSKAVKSDDFEKAQEIRDLIKSRKDEKND